MTSRTGVLLPENSQASSTPSPPRPTSAGCSVSSTTRSASLPGCDGAGIAAERLRATGQGALVQVQRDRRAGSRLGHVARARLQPADVFEPAQFLDRAGADIGIAADAETTAIGQVFAQRKDAVAEVRLGRLAQPRHRAARRETRTFRGIDVGRMDQAPAMIDRRMIQQPGDRARTAPGEAVGDLLLLFGDVDVDRPAVVRC